jgi:hypothetical protein
MFNRIVTRPLHKLLRLNHVLIKLFEAQMKSRVWKFTAKEEKEDDDTVTALHRGSADFKRASDFKQACAKLCYQRRQEMQLHDLIKAEELKGVEIEVGKS